MLTHLDPKLLFASGATQDRNASSGISPQVQATVITDRVGASQFVTMLGRESLERIDVPATRTRR